jgi:mono/diheme cytochrome c family protein
MRRLVLVTLLAVPIAAVPAAAQDAALIKKGSEVYVAQKCSLCHSIAGKGNKQNPLDGVGAKLSADDIKHWIVNPKEMEAKLATKPKMPMKAFPKLPAADLDALVAYMLSLK